MARGPAKETTSELEIVPLQLVTTTLRIIGRTPMFHNRMANKAMQTLLVGGKRKSAADRLVIKHEPLSEYRNSAHIVDDGPTALGLPITAVKAAMSTAAIDTAGLFKSTTQRLLFMPGDYYALYGIPQLRMDVVRSADQNRTPDIRSRAFLPRWCAEVEIAFVSPQLSLRSVTTLLCNAGMLVGVGDFRQEKGKGAYGAFRVLGDQQDDEWDELVETQGREPQMEALADPEYANRETADLMAFYEQEVRSRAAIAPLLRKAEKATGKGLKATRETEAVATAKPKRAHAMTTKPAVKRKAKAEVLTEVTAPPPLLVDLETALPKNLRAASRASRANKAKVNGSHRKPGAGRHL